MKAFRTTSILLILMAGLLAGMASCRRTPRGSQANGQTAVQQEPEAPVSVDSLLVSYSRTPCFGMCPVFDCMIFKSGYAIYRGRNFVNYIGFYYTQMDKTALQHIPEIAERIGYFNLEDVYDNPNVTDLPSVTTVMVGPKGRKTVMKRYGGPKQLEELYQELDILIQQAIWKPLDKAPSVWSVE
ncbi:MAG: DUF6438 domain-containing protein [Flavobacteriales bacterium]|jgi:hypothetical protein